GIRGFHVTGVQTCALPISATAPPPALRVRQSFAKDRERLVAKAAAHGAAPVFDPVSQKRSRKIALREIEELHPRVEPEGVVVPRSEERRVGKRRGGRGGQ